MNSLITDMEVQPLTLLRELESSIVPKKRTRKRKSKKRRAECLVLAGEQSKPKSPIAEAEEPESCELEHISQSPGEVRPTAPQEKDPRPAPLLPVTEVQEMQLPLARPDAAPETAPVEVQPDGLVECESNSALLVEELQALLNRERQAAEAKLQDALSDIYKLRRINREAEDRAARLEASLQIEMFRVREQMEENHHLSKEKEALLRTVDELSHQLYDVETQRNLELAQSKMEHAEQELLKERQPKKSSLWKWLRKMFKRNKS